MEGSYSDHIMLCLGQEKLKHKAKVDQRFFANLSDSTIKKKKVLEFQTKVMHNILLPTPYKSMV